MRGVVYSTGKEYLGRIRNYHVWVVFPNIFQISKDTGQGDIKSPEGFGGYYNLHSALSLRNIPDNEIREFMKSNRYRISDSVKY